MDELPVVQDERTGKTTFCVGCPQEKSHCVTQGDWDPEARLTFIGESPSFPSVGYNKPFQGRNGILLRKILKALEKAFGTKLEKIKYSTAYAGGAQGKPTQETAQKCAPLWKSQWSAHYAQQSGTHVIVPLGLIAAKSVGITARKILDIRGRTQQRMIGNKQVIVVPTLSFAHLYTKPGLVTVAQQDIIRAVKLAYIDEYVPPKTIDELAKDYRFPKTIDEVKALCDEIIAYYDPAKQDSPYKWPISVDIETNTLKAFRKDAKVLMISFAWDDGKAAAILLDHADNTWYDPAEAWVHVRRVLECPKPKCFHNFKFDGQFLERVKGINVNNVTWDTLTGQHWLSEDQKGVYGLKALAPIYAPQYEGYEETLHEALRRGEEAAPTEEDAIKEAKELAAASGEVGDGSWFENFDQLVEAEEEEALEKESNDAWRADPAWPDTVSDDDKATYRQLRDEWFKLDADGKGKERGAAIRRWRKHAKKLNLPEPTPVTSQILAQKKKEGFEKVDIATLLPYAAADADVTRIILKKQYRKLHTTKGWDAAHDVMAKLYVPGSRTLGLLELRGAKVDLEKARQYESALAAILDETQGKIYDLACRHFKINGAKQLVDVLGHMGLVTDKRTKGGASGESQQMSTSKDVLVGFQKDLVYKLHSLDVTDEDRAADTRRLEFVEALLLYRTAYKMKSSFLKRIREYSALDGHIHTTFHLTGTSTGRLSSSKLNLQNLPLYMCRITRPNPSDPENPFVIHPGFNVKALLIPEGDDEVFWNLDIKAAEIRVACYYSGDEALINAVKNGLDIHTFIATRVKHPDLTGEALDAKYHEYYALYKADDRDFTAFRSAIKRVVFGTLYGAGPTNIAAQIGGNYSKEKAKDLINAVFTMFPGLKRYVDETKREVLLRGEVSTIFGRIRRFWMAAVSDELKAKSQREAVNFRIQSTSSDLVVAQLCEIEEHMHEIEGVIRLTVHDSIAGTIKKNRVQEMKAFFDKWLVERVKERFPWLPVPFLYDLEIGPSYGEKMKYKEWVAANAA